MEEARIDSSSRRSAARISAVATYAATIAAAFAAVFLGAVLPLATSGCVDRRDVVVLFGGDEHAWIVPAG